MRAQKRLREIQEDVSLIGDVRGKDLMIGVKLVKDRRTKEAATKERDKLIDETFKQGVLLLGAGPSSIRLAPPLILKNEQADSGLDIIEGILRKL